jgi:hypothetical protein
LGGDNLSLPFNLKEFMGRKRKNNVIQEEMKLEGTMSGEETLETIQKEIDKARVELETTKREVEEKKLEMQRKPYRELDKDEERIVEKQVTMSNERESLKAKIEAQRAYDSELVTGKFMNRRAPGQTVKLTYLKYETDPVKWYEFQDGKVYTIPRGFAEQLNEHYHTPHFIQKQGDMDPNRPSSAIHEVDTSNKKYAFVPVTF